MQVPSIQIHQQYAKLGIDADLGRYDIRQPRAEVEIQTTPPTLSIESRTGELTIDQSKAWDALALGGNLNTMSRIYSQGRQAVLEGISRRADEGSQLAAVHHAGNPLAEIAKQSAYREHAVQVAGEATVDNVDITYIAIKPEIMVHQGQVDIRVIPNKPEITYQRGKLDIYMTQYGNVTITPPQIDYIV